MAERQARMDRRFTLIELLVVVAIIAILAAMLLPVLGRARLQAKKAVCVSNLKQLYLATVSYADEGDGILPYEATAHFWNEELLLQRQDAGGGLPGVGPIQLGRVYWNNLRDGALWGCPATDYTCMPDRRVVYWTPQTVNQVSATGTAGVCHGWMYYGPTTTAHYIYNYGDGGTGTCIPIRITDFMRLDQRKPAQPLLSDRYLRTDFTVNLDVVAHRQEDINVARNDGAVWRRSNPQRLPLVDNWTDFLALQSPTYESHPWGYNIAAGQAAAAVDR